MFFFVNVVKYLKFIVTCDDVAMNFWRIIIIRNWFISRFFKNIQIFFEFTNFYRRFIYKYFQITLFLTNMLKKNKKKRKKKSFHKNKNATQTFNRFREIFKKIFILMHFDFQLRIWIKTNIFIYVLIDIIFQLQTNDQWHSIVFYSKKIISTKRNYKTHDQKLLIIIDNF